MGLCSFLGVCSSEFTGIKRNAGLAYDIGEKQVPSCDKGPHLPYSHIAVEVGRARLGHPGAKLSIAQSSEDRRHGGNEEADDDTGPGHRASHFPRQHVHPGTEGAAHPQRHQVKRGEAAAKVGLFSLRLEGLPAAELPKEREQLGTPHPVGGNRDPDSVANTYMRFT